jgi:hypothetical protein
MRWMIFTVVRVRKGDVGGQAFGLYRTNYSWKDGEGGTRATRVLCLVPDFPQPSSSILKN